MNRRWEFDALRGLMLVLMTVTHLPTVLSELLGQPFGFVSAAEGFVLLSGFMAGLVYTQRQIKRGDDDMQRAFLARALKVYLCQAGLLVFLLGVVASIGTLARQPAITNLVSFYLQHPLSAALAGLLLVYAPPLLDILPMYVLFLLSSPLLLLVGRRQGFGWLLAASVALWVGSLFGLGQALYDAVASVIRLPVPYRETGAFEILSWQFLWVLGLWLGAELAANPKLRPVFPRWMLVTAIAWATVCLVWRHAVGQTPFPAHAELAPLFDKWQLGPLRVINLFALMVLVIHFGPFLVRVLPRPRVLELLGAASLPVFCTHLVMVLLALATVGSYAPGRPWVVDALLLVLTFAALFGAARLSAWLDQSRVVQGGRAVAKRVADRVGI